MMNKKLKKQKGITLIALVITIIVMLILVAVTINMAINGELFSYAGRAKKETQNAIDAENKLASGKIKVDENGYDSINEYLDYISTPNLIYFTVAGKGYETKENTTWYEFLNTYECENLGVSDFYFSDGYIGKNEIYLGGAVGAEGDYLCLNENVVTGDDIIIEGDYNIIYGFIDVLGNFFPQDS